MHFGLLPGNMGRCINDDPTAQTHMQPFGFLRSFTKPAYILLDLKNIWVLYNKILYWHLKTVRFKYFKSFKVSNV